MARDYVSEILGQVAGDDDVGDDDVSGDDDVGDDEVGLDYDTEQFINHQVSGLVEVGALTEVGARKAKKVIRRGIQAGRAKQQRTRGGRAPQTQAPQQQQRPQMQYPRGNSGMPSPTFARSGRDTERRAPLGFSEDGTGHNFFTLAAAIGATTTMRAKVSRGSHVDRLLIVPTAPGVVIESIKVGDEEQALASGVPVELYGTAALTDTLTDNFSPIGPGLDFIITLRNTTAAAITGTIGTKCAVLR